MTDWQRAVIALALIFAAVAVATILTILRSTA